MGGVDIQALEPLFGLPTEQATSAKQLSLEVVPLDWVVQFNFQWHSQLPDLPRRVLDWGDLQVGHALTFDGGVYAVAVWTRPVAANRLGHPTHHLAELRRLAIPSYAPKYTATRALGQMERWFRRERDECRLLSYQMTDVHSGTIYKAANWHVASEQTAFLSWRDHSQQEGRGGRQQNAAPKVRWERCLRQCEER